MTDPSHPSIATRGARITSSFEHGNSFDSGFSLKPDVSAAMSLELDQVRDFLKRNGAVAMEGYADVDSIETKPGQTDKFCNTAGSSKHASVLPRRVEWVPPADVAIGDNPFCLATLEPVCHHLSSGGVLTMVSAGPPVRPFNWELLATQEVEVCQIPEGYAAPSDLLTCQVLSKCIEEALTSCYLGSRDKLDGPPRGYDDTLKNVLAKLRDRGYLDPSISETAGTNNASHTACVPAPSQSVQSSGSQIKSWQWGLLVTVGGFTLQFLKAF
ncbi:hypothetical protein QFC22_002086 [Naganishia vaughanmartiniae]|uniref:Uncharacterized protein n=1 Tax=Naganishia vaughanmartiniae TaxID=1424756 RepID=A0ACC2XDN3_9TREE|nr:hypothetical protein QFC22_002086 [Naganishia vaughanmartiniae]